MNGQHEWRKNTIFTLKNGTNIFRCKWCGEEEIVLGDEHEVRTGTCPKHIIRSKNEGLPDKK